MSYTKISPLGPRLGPGTFDCVFDTDKYVSVDSAVDANDFVKIDFVKNEEDIIFFEFSHSKLPNEKTYKRLQIQHFPFGIDVFDDNAAMISAGEILEHIKTVII